MSTARIDVKEVFQLREYASRGVRNIFVLIFFFHFGALTEQLMVTLAIKDGGLSDYFFLFKNAIAR